MNKISLELAYNFEMDIKTIHSEINNQLREIYKLHQAILSEFNCLWEKDTLSNYTPQNYYLLKRFEKYLEVYDVTFYPQDHELDQDDQADYLYEFWTEGDFCQEFLDLNSKILSPVKASQAMLELEKRRLINIVKVIIHNESRQDRPAILELNETENSPRPYDFDLITIENDQFYFAINHELAPQFKQRTIVALKKLKQLCPMSYLSVHKLTQYIIPINIQGMVSYSLENLPSVSCINYHERDDIDLLDDLTHENGHHHLNYFLRTQELIYEDDQEIFYSPWRRTLRPIRGLYHATFTFFYASQLFYQLSKLENNDFNKNELKKIHNRFCQEFLMIESTRKLLDHAFKLDKISPAGKLLIEQVLNENLKFKPLYDQLQASFTQEYFEDFLQVKNELKANLEKYHKKLRIELI